MSEEVTMPCPACHGLPAMANPRLCAYCDGTGRVSAQRATSRPPRAAFRPERIEIPASDGGVSKDWEVRSIMVGNAAVPPPTDEDRKREEEAARRHDPIVARTLMGGPGNRSHVHGCACRAEGVHDAKTWAAHVGIPGGDRFIKIVLALRDAAQDAIDYPSDDTLAKLSAILERTAL